MSSLLRRDTIIGALKLYGNGFRSKPKSAELTSLYANSVSRNSVYYVHTLSTSDEDDWYNFEHILGLINDQKLPSRFWTYVYSGNILEYYLYLDHQIVINEFADSHNVVVDGWFIFGSLTEEMTSYSFINKRQNGILKESDIDVVVITDSVPSNSKFSYYMYDIQTMTVDDFNRYSNYSHVLVAEILFRRKQLQLAGFNVDRKHHMFWFGNKLVLDQPVDSSVIRHTFSEKSSHSFVKAKKKLIDGDIRSAHKSYFHSLKLLHLAIAICNDSDAYIHSYTHVDFDGGALTCDRRLIIQALKRNNDDMLPDWSIIRYKEIKKRFKHACKK